MRPLNSDENTIGSETAMSGSSSYQPVGDVPRHPKWCPDCLGKGRRSSVKIYRLNEKKEAIYMCSNMEVR